MIQSPEPDAAPAVPPRSRVAAPDPGAPAADRWWLAPLALLAGFGLLLWQVEAHGPVTGLDIRVRDHLQSWASSPSLAWLAAPGRDLADLGNQSIALLVLFAATVLAVRITRSWWPVGVMVGALAALATVIPLKLAIGRPGPGQVTLGDASLGFFPSGHTADAVLCYGTAALVLCAVVPPVGSGRRIRQAIVAVAASLVLLTIFGLLWSDYHWLSDILGSLCWCGAALLLLWRLLLRRFAAGSLVQAGEHINRRPLSRSE
jgi:undecaprenyl-diphosphatase